MDNIASANKYLQRWRLNAAADPDHTAGFRLRRASSLKGTSSGLRGAMEALPKPNVEAFFHALAHQHRLKAVLSDARRPEAHAKAKSQAFEFLMSSKVGRSWLGAYLESEYAHENLIFWTACQDFAAAATAAQPQEESFYDNAEEGGQEPCSSGLSAAAASSEEASPLASEALRLAERIVSEHVVPNAALEVNLSAEVRSGILTGLRARPLPPDLFRPAERHVYELLEREPFRRFLHSPFLDARLKETD